MPDTAVLVVGAVMVIVATIGVTVVLNFVSPAYDLANVWPKQRPALLPPRGEPEAIGVFVPTAVLAAVLALVPAFADIAPFSWPIAVVLSAAAYYWAARHARRRVAGQRGPATRRRARQASCRRS